MILAILLGPCAAFLTLASVLTVQALFFADGGLLALGSNIFNLGVFPCFIAYPLIYKKIVGRTPTAGRITAGAIVAAVCGLQLGSLGVVLETVLSGVAELPFGAFVLMMQPIHLAIGLVEGVVTAIVVCFLLKARPEVLASAVDGRAIGGVPMKKVLITLGLVSVLTAGVFSWFVSSHPDGLEWAIEKVTGGGDLEAPDQGVHPVLAELQERVAVLPDYGFRADGQGTTGDAGEGDMGQAGTTVAGLVGGLLTLGFAVLAGWLLRRFSRKA